MSNNNISEYVREELGGILESLNVDISDENIEEAYSLDVKHWSEISDKFQSDNSIESFNESFDDDFILARELILKSLDKTEKVMDEIFNIISVKTTPVMLELGQESAKNLQQGVKTLTDLHNIYQGVKQKDIKNKKELGEVEEKDEEFKDSNGNPISFE